MKISRIASVVLFAVFGLILSINIARADDNKNKTVNIKTIAPTTQIQSEIENKLYELDGVKLVTFENNNLVKVEFDGKKLSSDEIVYYMVEKGYSAEIVSTNDKKTDSTITNK